VAHRQDGSIPDPIGRRILEEMRDLHREMRDMRGEMRDMRGEMRADRQRSDEERRRSDDRFEAMMREFRADSARREAATQKAFKDVRSVGLAIVKNLTRNTRILEHVSRTLDSHGRILERIDRKLGARGNGLPGRDDGR
jgi:hypothetical protein